MGRARWWIVGAAIGVILIAGVTFVVVQRSATTPPTSSAPGADAALSTEVARARAALAEVLSAHRKLIVLFADETRLNDAERDAASRVGQTIFHENLARVASLEAILSQIVASPSPTRFDAIGGLLDYVESDPDLFDADRLAFHDVARSLLDLLARDGSLPAVKLHKRLQDDLEALGEIERNYDSEIRQIFSRFEPRAIRLKREKWDAYVATLTRRHTREQILKDYGVVVAYPRRPDPPADVPLGAERAPGVEGAEVFGRSFPPRTLLLTFDDGPHKTYSPEIAAILAQYGVPAVFFEVGNNLGTLDEKGAAKLGARADTSRQLRAAGYTIANHSLTHAQLSKRTGDALKTEILTTDELLKAVAPDRSPLFRFPYGARNAEGLAVLAAAHLRSIMWNIDSLDWADPVPRSIVDRVMRSVEAEGRGIILFHDIHERTVRALPLVLDRLVAEGYRFVGWDGKAFSVPRDAAPPATTVTSAAGYADSWAIVIGIDEYAKWPRLQYAVRDARSIRDVLITKFGFGADRVLTLENGAATRMGILSAFHDQLTARGMSKQDRLFVFFAGHGATRQLSSGRDLGYIVPVDSDPDRIATDAIPMTEIQNIAENLSVKHALFVMDACYSGLGLARGGSAGNFLRDNARRLGRQMLTAGGADQLVADGGPGGHSVFTWALLQALAGRGDLNGDSLVTATELAAYVAPAVSSVSRQTPAFGSLPGSEGGDFVFELPAEDEFISEQTTQLATEAIALNSKLDATRPGQGAITPGSTAAGPPPAVMVKDLQGHDQTIVTPVAVPRSMRQLAQRANDRGLALYKEKRYAEAEAEFTEALKLRPDFALAANNLGFIYYKQDRFPEAARWFEQAISMDRSRAVAYVNLGDALAKSGKVAEARTAYETYLALAPSGPSAAYARRQLGS